MLTGSGSLMPKLLACPIDPRDTLVIAQRVGAWGLPVPFDRSGAGFVAEPRCFLF
ncbi:hypothetical protein [Microcoleus sp. bin38.metabat.b11b12b14.051]|uniref:hypothetical protein n=1 Tax=Microcoleus sp. bin38.metabat.b11b12b14.051 TaxID=2742709 RepID=UPI0025D96D1C|nr:hypothetical protein [Microcoleus sp. bin38.metabat.b11b12b14.051]